ncbi:hypothetical protein Kpol_1032p26 [Vanderwaltozyma polyspora DSM 70294]|uniref:HhH-GPD domain-containing protein n=1 Tax=Vanderwaltozyma polyspora (strain ATCC 22028 / DSM 70294 / BCRC 21397 / CBS 2163 / NBRC 10782 / NRRL Y-8283 / UCD 57-17) TaxID=436907 RepID=A7TGY1_VANPO|nr:uncharacterized protein Kpol_1032p26 [Vanderwaltozyma polyspora DSM 70294]EDO18433.1 hypothetical protein Kpol_1032p26 [Vanderwaltozyma polyspora DSM 70294]
MKRTREEVEKEDKERAQLPDEFVAAHSDEFIKACDFILSKEPSFIDIITATNFELFLREAAPFEITLKSAFTKLSCAIIAQQISGKAGNSIKGRVIDLFDGTFPTYQQLKEAFKNDKRKQEVRGCGVSARKVTYLESLVNYFVEKEDEIDKMFKETGNDQEVIDHLVENIKGVGVWSAKMFLITGLKRYDVFASEDLGAARGCSRYFSENPELLKELTAKRTEVIKSKHKKNSNWKVYDDDLVISCGDRFAPYRTVFMFILWRLSATNVEVIANNERQFVRD